MTIFDFIDIFIVGLLIFLAYRFISERRAGKLALGIIMLVALATLSEILKLRTIAFLMSNLFQVGIIAIIIVFQPELRAALETLGKEPLKTFKSFGDKKSNQTMNEMIDAVSDACAELSSERTGAIIVIERTTKLGDIIKSGTVINAEPTQFLIRNIFYEGAPLHDGAVVIREGRVYAAGCFLPLTMNSDITKDLGSRHRASIGMSENSDAIVVVVSEETGTISIATDGNLERGYNRTTLKKELVSRLIEEETGSKFKKIKKNHSEIFGKYGE